MANIFEEWYKSMPIVTKTYMTGCVVTSLAVFLEVIHPLDLYLNFSRVIYQYELWRLISNFLFFDTFGINFLFHMYFLVRHSRFLEESSFRNRTADFVMMWLFGAFLLLLIDVIFYYTGYVEKLIFLAPSLSFMIVYVWSRRNPTVRMSFLGLFTFNAPYLPWVILGFGVMLGHNPVYDVLGIAVGHLYFWLEDVYLPMTGRKVLKTPGFLKFLLDGPQPPVTFQAPNPPEQQPQDQPQAQQQQHDL